MTFVMTMTLVPGLSVTLVGLLVLGPVRALAVHSTAWVLTVVVAGVSAVAAGLNRATAAYT